MKPILTDDQILSEYNNSNAIGKDLLEKIYGKETFEKDLWDIINSFEDGLAYKNLKAEDVLPVVPAFMKHAEKNIHGFFKLIFLIEIFNQGWVADFSNSNQVKYYPWFRFYSGSGLSLDGVAYDLSIAYVAARLCLKSREDCEKFTKRFKPIYDEYILNN